MTDTSQAPTGGVSGTLAGWLAGLGPLAASRPPPSLGQAVAGVGGALLAVGVVVLGGDRWANSGSSGVGLVLSAALLAGSLVAVVRLPPLRAVAGVAASGVATPALAFFLTAGGGFPSLREVALLAGILLAGLYTVGPWRGHTFHLAILVVAGWLVALSLGNTGAERAFFGGFGSLAETITASGAASMIVGVAYLGLGSWLHDEGLEGMATPFLGAAALALSLGAFAVLRDSADGLQGLVALAVGAALAFVGARCRRRGTTWIGLAVAAFGVFGVVSAVSGRAGVVAVLVAAAGSGLVLAAPYAAAVVGEPVAVVASEAAPAAIVVATADAPETDGLAATPPTPVTTELPAVPTTETPVTDDTPPTTETAAPRPGRVRRDRPTRPPGAPRVRRPPRPPAGGELPPKPPAHPEQ